MYADVLQKTFWHIINLKIVLWISVWILHRSFSSIPVLPLPKDRKKKKSNKRTLRFHNLSCKITHLVSPHCLQSLNIYNIYSCKIVTIPISLKKMQTKINKSNIFRVPCWGIECKLYNSERIPHEFLGPGTLRDGELSLEMKQKLADGECAKQ